MGQLALGLMSGTSCDGVSAALTIFQKRTLRVIAQHTYPYPRWLSKVLQQGSILPAETLSALNVVLGEEFAHAALDLLRHARIARRRVYVIGSHGHTLYHGPRDQVPSTLQLGEPAVISERTQIPVVADFRMRDIAAGGEGAPLVPYFDHYFYGRGPARALQNIGGIANVSIVGRGIRPIAFDTGPGNCLIDTVVQNLSHGRMQYDKNGELARSGRIDEKSVKRLWAHPYFRRVPPKSTGKELFNLRLLKDVFGERLSHNKRDILATVTYFTACSISESYHRFIPIKLREVIVSGGGVHNRTLMHHLAKLLSPTPVRSTQEYGIPPQAKEPAAFAFLALRALGGYVNHLPATTGARHACILGKITPAH